MRVSACQCCGESINAGTRGPVPIKCGPCLGRRRPGGPPLPKKVRPKKPPEERIRSDRFTFVPGRIQSECGHCGRKLWLFPKVFATQQRHFCGRECRGLADRRAVPHRYKCVRCGKECSMQGNPRQKQKGLYCSRLCAGLINGERRIGVPGPLHKALASWFHKWGDEEPDTRIVELERSLFPHSRMLYRIRLLRRCADCGGPREKGSRVFCCGCLSARKKRSYRKSGKLRSRCKHFGVEYDSKVNRLSVCNRDGWICAICGVKTIKEANRKHPHPLEGTLDHIIPLSKRTKGNTWDNVQCACRNCNCHKKRDQILCCQMRLF